ncbi:MAG: hypothetical protein ABIQ55_09260, partial [Gemmatimonadaceae bacterium]
MHRILTTAIFAGIAAAAISTTACGQDTTHVAPGVRLELRYPRGTTPKVVVMPVDPTPGDSVRTIIQRDLDYSDRVTLLVLDDETLAGLTPAPGQNYNYSLFANLGVAAIIQAKRTATGYSVALYDVSAARRLDARDFRVAPIPPNRDATLVDSITTATTFREKSLRDAMYRTLKTRADVMRRPRLAKDTRQRRFVVRDSLRRDSAAAVYLKRGINRWEDDRRDSVTASITSTATRLARQDSVNRIATADAQRMGLHRISDEVERWITGKSGIAASRIAYSQGGVIRIVDSDGANDRALTRGGLAMSPAWHPSADKLIYSKFVAAGGGTQLEEAELATGRTRTIGGGGLNITPVYSHDGQYVVYASGSESGTDLMMVNVQDPAV